MEKYPSNAHKTRETLPEKKVEKVVEGTVRTKKKSEIKKFADIFVAEDMASVKSYIFEDVLIPTIKRTISDIVTNGLDILLYGEAGRIKKNSTASKISYRSYYERENDRRRDYSAARVRNGYEFEDVILDSRGEAEEVLSRMDELVSTYGMASVADFYDLVGIAGNYTDNKYGWTETRNMTVMRVRDGYMIKMPRAISLN